MPETITIHPADLALYHRNPRRGDIPAIRASLRANGQYKPIVVNQGTHTGRPMEVLTGNHTLMAVRDLAEQYPDDERWQQVIAYVIDVDDDRAGRIVAADNRIPELGTFDERLLLELLADLPDLDGTGYTENDLLTMQDAVLDSNDFKDADDLIGDDDTITRYSGEVECPNCGHTFVPSVKSPQEAGD